MERNEERRDDELIDLGVASIETKGIGTPVQDNHGGLVAGITDE